MEMIGEQQKGVHVCVYESVSPWLLKQIPMFGVVFMTLKMEKSLGVAIPPADELSPREANALSTRMTGRVMCNTLPSDVGLSILRAPLSLSSLGL